MKWVIGRERKRGSIHVRAPPSPESESDRRMLSNSGNSAMLAAIRRRLVAGEHVGGAAVPHFITGGWSS
jgi:hypothetical protein